MTLSKKRVLFGVPLLAALVLALLGAWSNRALQRTLEAKLGAELQTTLNANVTALEIWINTQTRLASVLAGDPAIRQLVTTLLEQTRAADPDRRALAALPEQLALQRALDERIQASGYGGVQVMSTNLQIVGGSTRVRMRLGTPVESEHAAAVREVLTNGRPVLITPFKAGFRRPPGGPGGRGGARWNRGPGAAPGSSRPVTPLGGPGAPDRPPTEPPGPGTGSEGPSGGPTGLPRPDFNLMEVVAPVRDGDGAVIAALGFILRPEEEFTRVLSVARPGDTGETFAFDPGGRLISESRFDEQLKQLGLLTNAPGVSSSLNVELRDPGGDLTRGFHLTTNEATARPLTAMVAEAVAGGSGLSVKPVRDYRGVPVVGAWQWLPDRNFGVVTKLDAAEAFQPLRVLRFIFLTLVLLLALTTLVMLVSSYWNVVWHRRFDEARLQARQLGQYTLGEKIGEGGMGVVYRASHALLRRETAVKLLLPDRADDEVIRQFEHEVQLTCRLTHPNTIQIYDYGHTADGIFYYAMELLHGMTLHQLIQRHGAQPEERVIHLLAQVCESLQEAHAVGLIHRDIKPGNLFLCERGRVPDTVKVLDFGLVRRFTADATARNPANVDTGTHRFLGTPLYMAPETIRDPGAGDPRSDLYAVGAVGYLLLTGQPVFEGKTVGTLWEQHRTETPLAFEHHAIPSISPELEAVIHRCLEKDPDRRPKDAGELLAALRHCPRADAWTLERRQQWWARHVGAGAPTAAPPPGPGDVTVKIDLADRVDHFEST